MARSISSDVEVPISGKARAEVAPDLVAATTARRGRPSGHQTVVERPPAMDDGIAASRRLDALLQHLRASIASYVAERRATGVSVQRLTSELRCVVREADSCDTHSEASAALLRLVLEWGIEGYEADRDRSASVVRQDTVPPMPFT